MLWTYPPLYNMVKKQNVAQQRLGLQNYLPKPLCVLVEGTAPCRNSCLELSRMSWSPAMMETPPLPAQTGDQVRGGGGHRHGEGDLLCSVAYQLLEYQRSKDWRRLSLILKGG